MLVCSIGVFECWTIGYFDAFAQIIVGRQNHNANGSTYLESVESFMQTETMFRIILGR